MNELRAKRFDLAIAASVRENVLRDAEKFLAIDEYLEWWNTAE